VTAAGFQLKGTGWYATDFKNKGSSSGDKGGGSGDKGGTSDAGSSESSAKADAPACGAGACPACN